ncbi:family 43 glycosylhydrolase [Microbacterium sp. B2969]|uniref:Family 43 glycosylhydrolase n=1 Tax=Microbacterium alkaliflavum TaxID=3248839 RepID=A0ABW7QES4_9MICO
MDVPAHPVLAGCHPDPSVCRVGEHFYLVTSTFTYVPGLPVHRSIDLVAWELVGHVLTDASAIGLDGLDVSDGVWAPTIRHHDGTFYVVFTVAVERRAACTYVCTATDAAGPWSAPVPLDAHGIDPSLFFDDDGRCWFTAARDAVSVHATGPGELWMRELDVAALRLVGPEYVLWHGALAGQWVEAPHLYRRDGRYVLIAAEGGTERNHAVTAAYADAVTGPYSTDPRSPLLTHRHLSPHHPVQNVGHVDLVDTADGRTLAVALGVRLLDGCHVLGRETFVVPVDWDDHRPVFAAGLGRLGPIDGAGVSEERDWVGVRDLPAHSWAGDDLTLSAGPHPLSERGRMSFVGLRQDRHDAVLEGTIDTPRGGGRARALVAFQHQDRFVAHTLLRNEDGSSRIETVLWADGAPIVLGTAAGHESERLLVETDGRRYRFGARRDGAIRWTAQLAARLLSTEDAGGFVGVLLGFSNLGDDRDEPAVIRDVRYGTATAEAGDPELRRTTSVGGMR